MDQYLSQAYDQLTSLFSSNPPPSIWSEYTSTMNSYLNILRTTSTTTSYLSYIHSFSLRVYSLFLQMLDLFSSNATSPLATIALLLFILFISLKILDMLYRSVMFWVKWIFRVTILVGVVVLGAWINIRGWDGVQDDVMGLKGYWLDEYRRYEMMVEGARNMRA